MLHRSAHAITIYEFHPEEHWVRQREWERFPRSARVWSSSTPTTIRISSTENNVGKLKSVSSIVLGALARNPSENGWGSRRHPNEWLNWTWQVLFLPVAQRKPHMANFFHRNKNTQPRWVIYIPEMIIQYEIIVIQRLFKLFISIFMDSPLHHKSFDVVERRGQKIIKRWFRFYYSMHILRTFLLAPTADNGFVNLFRTPPLLTFFHFALRAALAQLKTLQSRERFSVWAAPQRDRRGKWLFPGLARHTVRCSPIPRDESSASLRRMRPREGGKGRKKYFYGPEIQTQSEAKKKEK